MSLPKSGHTYATERLGIAAVQVYAASRRQIWRETGTGDVGIDGNIEFVNLDGYATGRIVAVQVKAGVSYFKHRTEKGWKFYPGDVHRNYWESFPLPVLLVLHDPDAARSYWTDARRALRGAGRSEETYIEVPQENVLDETDPFKLFESAGAQNQDFISNLEDVLRALVSLRSRNANFPLSYFDLFAHGLTNIGRSMYYGADAICGAAEFNLEASGSSWAMGMGDEEHRFAFGFVKFLLAQNLAQIDYSDCMVDWVDRQVQPHFVAPLTSRGRALVALIREVEGKLVEEGKLADGKGIRVAQEGFFGMIPESYMPRFPRIREFQRVLMG